MKSAWKFISYLGMKSKESSFATKGNILSNQINFILAALMLFAFILLKIESKVSNEPMEFGSLRVLLIGLTALLNLALAYLGFHRLSKTVLATVPAFLFLILPTLIGFIEEESFVYYPYVAITTSILSPILFSYENEKLYFTITYIYNLLLVAFSDVLLFVFSDGQFEIAILIKDFYFFYKFVQIIIFLFILSSIHYLKRINLQFERNLETKNSELLTKNKLIEKQKNELMGQNAVLNEQKEELQSLNEELQNYQEELNFKNEEISKTLDERIKIQSQLVQSEKMASLGILTAGIAHEINNPINFIYAGIQSLEENYKYLTNYQLNFNQLIFQSIPKDMLEEIRNLRKQEYIDDVELMLPQLIDNIKIGVQRTEEIVKGLRNFSRLDDVEFKKADIHEGIESTLLLLKNEYKKNIEIIKNYDKNIKDINCYPGQLNQVYLNLLKNAIYAIELKEYGGGKIWISSSIAEEAELDHYNLYGSYIKISVKDDGIGMSKEIKDKVFVPFFTTNDVGKGTGLGLSISHGIVEKHKGKLFVESEEGKGSEFIIFIPSNL